MTSNTPFLSQTRDFAYTNGTDEIEPPLSSPPLSSPGTSARFEFESGKGNEGTKILLVEWPSISGSQANIYWENMPNVGCLSVDDNPVPALGTLRRLFLLPAYSQIPRSVYVTTEVENLQTNPLPAIYTGRNTDNGRKGVLHTTFARARLSALEDEIRREAAMNAESVALEMALQEKAWIEQEYFFSDGSLPQQSSKKGKGKKSASRTSPKMSTRKEEEKKESRREQEAGEEESESELFAVKMGPRAPDGVMSPYCERIPDYVPWR